MKEKTWKRISFLLILGSILATIKLIFVDYTMDEEYQIIMGYRHVLGDALFGVMWEPHQTSAFFCSFLIWIFRLITGGNTGVLLFIRAVTVMVQILLSLWLYKVISNSVRKEYAFCIALCYFNIVPKLILIPEFSNLALWFFTIMVLSLMTYREKHQWAWLCICGVAMALEVLSYPSCLVLFPVVLVFLLWKNVKAGIRDCLIFAGTSAACAVVWLVAVLSKISVSEFLQNIRNVLSNDSTHNLEVSTTGKTSAFFTELSELSILFAFAVLLGVIIWITVRAIYKKKGKESLTKTDLALIIIYISEAIQFIYWTVGQAGFERPHIILFALLFVPLLFIKEMTEDTKPLMFGYIGSLVTIASVLYMSDLGIYNAIPTGMLGSLFALIMLVMIAEREDGANKVRIFILLVSLTFVFIFGKGFTLKEGRAKTNTILGVENIIRKGPAAGILTEYMKAYANDANYVDFQANIEPGDKVLIVTNLVEVAGTTPYMFADYEVCHFSIVDPTTYDEKLLTYWERYPEKKPNVIVVDCWYGQLMEEPDNWIMQYIENDFGYTSVVDGSYVRFYKK